MFPVTESDQGCGGSHDAVNPEKAPSVQAGFLDCTHDLLTVDNITFYF